MRKSLNFDLDTKKLKEHYPNKNYTNAYEDIKKFLIKNGFEHRQGSGYISKEAMTRMAVTSVIKELYKEFNWIYPCCKTLDYYDVGKEHSGLEILENIQKDKDKTLKIDKTKESEARKVEKEKEIKQTYKISNYQPKNKAKTKTQDIER